MTQRLFVGVQLPVVDLRCLVAGYVKLPAPSWPSPYAGVEFMRGIGMARDRPRGAPITALGENTFINAQGKLFRLAPKREQKRPGFRTAYARLFGTEMGYRLDLGLIAGRHERSSMQTFAAKILKEKAFLGKQNAYPLHQYGFPLATRLTQQSTPHHSVYKTEAPVTMGRSAARDRMLVHAGRPLLMIENWGEGVAIGLEGQSTYLGSKLIPVWELSLDKERPELSRNLRATIWRLHFEHEVLMTVLTQLRSPQPIEFDKERLLEYLDGTTRILVRQSYAGYDQPSLLAVANRIGGFDSSMLSQSLEYLRSESQGISRRLDLIIERTSNRAATLWGTDVPVVVQNAKKVEFILGDRITAKNNQNSPIVNRSRQTTMGFNTDNLSSPDFIEELEEFLSADEIRNHPTANEIAVALEKEVKGPKRPEVARALWTNLKSSSPVISAILAAASLVNAVLGG